MIYVSVQGTKLWFTFVLYVYETMSLILWKQVKGVSEQGAEDIWIKERGHNMKLVTTG
jgi:hypothetical protein